MNSLEILDKVQKRRIYGRKKNTHVLLTAHAVKSLVPDKKRNTADSQELGL